MAVRIRTANYRTVPLVVSAVQLIGTFSLLTFCRVPTQNSPTYHVRYSKHEADITNSYYTDTRNLNLNLF